MKHTFKLLGEESVEILPPLRRDEAMHDAVETICREAKAGDIEALKQLREISEEVRFRNMILNSDDDEYTC